ncbi:MazG-like family protein [Haemophilus haemolyticus]|uniref:MazG-like family protein n=1 Tax=Haemophilus haemolyticus TaxID=726 RepID=UPI000E572B59|nr:MazG-like family protein [Haemophilus haemolyticus]
MKELITNIEQWAKDRNLIEGSTPQKQMLKLIEEYGELTSGVIKNNAEKIKDSIGDCLVVLSVLNSQFKKCGEVFKFDKYLTEILSLELDSNHGLNKEEVIIDGLRALHGIANLEHRFGRRHDDFLFDFLLVLRFIADETSMRLEECMQAAWDEIKNRKGRMINGVFIKESDL